MNNQVKITIILFFAFAFLVSLVPSNFGYAAKFQSGVTINAPSIIQKERICNDMIDNDHDGSTDLEDEDCFAQGATCGLQIVSGVPINYGLLSLGQLSTEQKVTIKNEGTSLAKVMLKGGDWISDAAGNPIISGPEITRAAIASVDYNNKKSLSSNGWELAAMPGGYFLSVFFQFKVPTSGVVGSLHQEVTMDLLC